MGTAFVEAVKELLAWGVQKPPRRVGEKQFPGQFSAAPAAMVEIPASLRTRHAWGQLDHLGGHLADVAVMAGPGGLPRRHRMSGMVSMAVHTLRRLTAMISRCPTWRVKS